MTTTKRKTQQAPAILPQIVIKQPQRKTSDVSTWRTALQAADMGRMKLLYDLYEDLLIDGVLADAVDKRIDAVTNSPITFQNANGEEIPEITDLIDSPDFEELLVTIMNVRFWGRAAGEFSFADGWFNFAPIPFKHISLDTQSILINESDDKGIPYEGDDHLMVLGKKRNFGLFLKTAPYAIWKRGGFGDYAQWIELFGMPQRVGKYSSYDPESRRLLVEAMEQAGSAPWIVIPKESDVETVNNTGTGSSSSAHNEFRKACNEEMLITILGQTMTTLDGSSRSQSETHKEVEEGKNKSDLRYVRRVLNWIVVPILEKRGYKVAGGKFVFPESVQELTVENISTLADLIDIPASYIHNKFSIPEPKEGEQIAKKRTASTNPPPKEGAKKPGESNQEEVKLHDQLSRWERIVDFFVHAPAPTGAVKQQSFIGRLTSSITGNIKLSDGYSINIAKLVDEALREIYNEPEKGLVNPGLFNITNNALQKAISIEVNQEDDNWGKTNSAFIQQFRENTAVFAAFKSHQEQNEMVGLLIDEKGELRSFSKFKKLALEVSKDYDINWLRTEYNTAVRSARAAINFRKYLETEHLYPNLEYMESTAEHKRGDHLEYVGTILIPTCHHRNGTASAVCGLRISQPRRFPERVSRLTRFLPTIRGKRPSLSTPKKRLTISIPMKACDNRWQSWGNSSKSCASRSKTSSYIKSSPMVANCICITSSIKRRKITRKYSEYAKPKPSKASWQRFIHASPKRLVIPNTNVFSIP